MPDFSPLGPPERLGTVYLRREIELGAWVPIERLSS